MQPKDLVHFIEISCCSAASAVAVGAISYIFLPDYVIPCVLLSSLIVGSTVLMANYCDVDYDY